MQHITEKIIGCAFTVANTLGNGFLEKVYENALMHELKKQGLHVEQQRQISVFYDGIVVGDYTADMIVEKEIIVELKAIKSIEDVHTGQCLNYLKATGFKLCLLINFGTPKIQIKRIVNGL